MANQVGLVFLLIYACGALVELLIRMSLGVPAWAKPAFEQHICLVALQPVVFMLLPAILWPLVALYRLFRPVYDFTAERLARREAAKAAAAAAATTAPGGGAGGGTAATTADGGIPLTSSRTSIASSLHDLEKQEIQIETAPAPGGSRTRTATA